MSRILRTLRNLPSDKSKGGSEFPDATEGHLPTNKNKRIKISGKLIIVIAMVLISGGGLAVKFFLSDRNQSATEPTSKSEQPKAPWQAEYDQALSQYRDRNFSEAVNKLEKLAPQIGKAWALNNLALAYKEQKELDKSIDTYQQALKLDPESSKIYNNLAVAYKAQGKLDLAEQTLLKSLSLRGKPKPQDPESVSRSLDSEPQADVLPYSDPLLNLASLYQAQKKWNQSAQFLERFLLEAQIELSKRNQLTERLRLLRSLTQIQIKVRKDFVLEKTAARN